MNIQDRKEELGNLAASIIADFEALGAEDTKQTDQAGRDRNALYNLALDVRGKLWGIAPPENQIVPQPEPTDYTKFKSNVRPEILPATGESAEAAKKDA